MHMMQVILKQRFWEEAKFETQKLQRRFQEGRLLSNFFVLFSIIQHFIIILLVETWLQVIEWCFKIDYKEGIIDLFIECHEFLDIIDKGSLKWKICIHTVAIGNYIKAKKLTEFLIELSSQNGGGFMGVASLD